MGSGELDRLVESSDWQGVRDALSAMSAADLADAATWYRSTGRALARELADRTWREDSRLVQLLLALSLAATPREASRGCRWGRHFVTREDYGGTAACADALIWRGREWAQGFVDLTTAAVFRGESERGAEEVTSLANAAVTAYGLPIPTTETYARGWAQLVHSAHVYAGSESREQWYPPALLTAADGRARPAYELKETLTLRDCLAGTQSATAVFATALATPNVFKEWATFTLDGWQVEPTIRDAVATGLLDRGPLLEAAFTAFSRDDRAHNQRVIAEVLKGLDPTPEEVRARAALILHVLPTVHGSVTRTLLELALAADLPEDELIDLGAVILARPEKAQKTTLIRHLATATATATGGAVEVLLTMAADSDDAALAKRARTLLGTAPEAEAPTAEAPTAEAPAAGQPPSAAGLPPWSHEVEPFQPGPFAAYPDTEAGLDRAHSDDAAGSSITLEAAYLDLLVRFAHRDPSRFQSVVKRPPEPNWDSDVRTPKVLREWVLGERPSSRVDAEGRRIGLQPPAPEVVTDHLIEETLPRLGPLEELLSTPSRSDGTLDLTVLADRVRRAEGYAPYDLLQALLRVGPTAPGDVRLFDGLSLRPLASTTPARSGFFRRRTPERGPDGVEAIRTWVGAGGWAPRVIDARGLAPRSAALALPLPEWLLSLEGVEGMSTPVGAEDSARMPWRSDAPAPWLSVCPWDIENVAAMAEHGDEPNSVVHARRLHLLSESAGPFGVAVHHHLARLLGHPRLDCRLLAAQQTGVLARQGRLDPELLRERSMALFSEGALSLARVAHGWAELAAVSSMSTIWPAWLSVLDAACGADRKPAGLADLLRATREHAPVVVAELGTTWVPSSVRELAATRSSTKAVTEARAVIEAVEAGAPR